MHMHHDRIDRDRKAEIVGRLYEVAIDPACFETRIDIAQRRFKPLRPPCEAPVDEAFGDSQADTQIAWAPPALERFDERAGSSGLPAALAELGRKAAFVSADGRRSLVANAAASQIFAVGSDSPISAMPIGAADAEALCGMIRDIVARRRTTPVLFRARPSRGGRPLVLRVRPIRHGGRDLALVVAAELAWVERLDAAMRDAFSLTATEIEIVRAITEGRLVKEIARARNRSTETVRTQVRSILSKTRTHSQSELVGITLGLMDAVGAASDA